MSINLMDIIDILHHFLTMLYFYYIVFLLYYILILFIEELCMLPQLLRFYHNALLYCLLPFS